MEIMQNRPHMASHIMHCRIAKQPVRICAARRFAHHHLGQFGIGGDWRANGQSSLKLLGSWVSRFNGESAHNVRIVIADSMTATS